MKFGLHLDSSINRSATSIISHWQKLVSIADASGFDYVSVVDHLVPFPYFRPIDTPLFDPWQLLTAFATKTKNVTLLTLVSNASISHPTRLAKQASTLDIISEGRMMLGLGAGGYAADDSALGINRRSQKERFARLDESADILRMLWTGGETSYQGRWHSLDCYTSSPTPLSEPRLLIAGKSKPILHIAAHRASACNFAFTDSTELKILIAQFEDVLELTTKTLDDIEVTLLDRVFIGASNEDANRQWHEAGAPTVNGHPGLIGGAELLVENIVTLEEAGADTLFLMFNNLEALQRFSDDVVSQFQK
jgi:alkanesulfonate monooxygenase SsuD/methylene tetrahydromethanopterin reductase-like flavin-dependent oxidoreductase (luciferase family)